MSLYASISEHLKEAMKQGETERRDTLRLIQSAVKNVAIDKHAAPAELSDKDIQDVLRRLVKQRKDSIEQYRAGNREDLAVKEEAELLIISAYLPQAMPESELRAIVEAALREAGISAKTQMGQAMGVAVKSVAGRAPGDDVKRVVESLLS